MIQPTKWELEGQLVRDWWEYENDDLEIDGKDFTRFLLDTVPNLEVWDGNTRSRTYFGRVRVTVEVLEPPQFSVSQMSQVTKETPCQES